MRHVQFEHAEADLERASRGGDESRLDLGEALAVEGDCGSGQPSATAAAEGATACHGKSPRAASSSFSGLPPFSAKGARVDALRPAWASCMPGTQPMDFDEFDDGPQGFGLGVVPDAEAARRVMRPRSSTAVASVNTRPALPRAKALR